MRNNYPPGVGDVPFIEPRVVMSDLWCKFGHWFVGETVDGEPTDNCPICGCGEVGTDEPDCNPSNDDWK